VDIYAQNERSSITPSKEIVDKMVQEKQ